MGLWRRPVTSLAPKTRRNQTARGIATALAWSKSSKSWPFAPCGTLFPSLCSGTDGLARSANHACLLASLGVTRWGMRKVDALQGFYMHLFREGDNEVDARYDDGPCTASKYLVHKVLELRNCIDIRASPKRFRRPPCFGLTDNIFSVYPRKRKI